MEVNRQLLLEKVLNYTLFCLPVSLLASLSGSYGGYFVAEVLALVYVIIVFYWRGNKAFKQCWVGMSVPLKTLFFLLIVGLITGIAFADSFITAISNVFIIFVLPLAVVFSMLVHKPKLQYLYYGILILTLGKLLHDGLVIHDLALLNRVAASARINIALLFTSLIFIVDEARRTRLGLILVIFLLVLLLGTRSFDAFLGLGCVIIWWVLRYWKIGYRLTVVAVFSALFIALVMWLPIHRMREPIDSSYQIHKSSLYLVSIYPLTGVGIGDFNNQYRLIVSKVLPAYHDPIEISPNNIFFYFWLEYGLAGVLALIGLVHTHSRDVVSFRQLYFIGIAGMGLTSIPFFLDGMALIFWLCCGAQSIDLLGTHENK